MNAGSRPALVLRGHPSPRRPSGDAQSLTRARQLDERRTGRVMMWGPGRRSTAWLPAVRASIGEPCRFHDLRHSHAALLIARGVHPSVIKERLGHASIRTTLDVYGHLFDGLDEAAADALDTAWHDSAAGSSRTPDERLIVAISPETIENPAREQGLLCVEVTGFEPVASSVRGKRSAGLSYTPRMTGRV